jgi:murein DD-endopeptidase MepM/ murein hydrolase activator NlpD
MKKLIAITAMTFAAGALSEPADAAVDAEQTKAVALLSLGVDTVDYSAAARAEGLVVPTRDYEITARFNQRGSMWSSGRHTGLDFAAAEGTPVFAGDSGTVVFAGSAGAYGNMVKIAHGDGVRTLYAHLSAIRVSKGDRVERGQRIGDLGNTGNSSGPHLHFEVLNEGRNVDPEKHINF